MSLRVGCLVFSIAPVGYRVRSIANTVIYTAVAASRRPPSLDLAGAAAWWWR